DDDDKVYTPLLGNQSELTGASLQLARADFADVHGRVAEWVGTSATASGGARPWVVAVDEPGDADWALMPDGFNHPTQPNNQEEGRKNALWGTLMAGGAGNEWYFGYRAPESDLWLQNFRSRDRWWDYTRFALEFFENNEVPFWEMSANDAITSADYGFYKADEVYVVYDKAGGNANLNLSGASGSFDVHWYDPRNGGALHSGTVTSVAGGQTVDLGNAPNSGNQDWVILVRKPISTAPVADAGVDQTIEDADNSGSEPITLDGSASTDSNGTIVGYAWSISGETIATGVSPTVDLAVGQYSVQLQVTDNDGETATETVNITVDAYFNAPPIANAGPDQAVSDADNNGTEIIRLDGSPSSDPDGSIVSYAWTLDGSQIATGVSPSVSLAVGTHVIQLEVTDNEGSTATDTVVITINAFESQAPIANAGPDQTAVDTDDNGLESILLDGSSSIDPDGGDLVTYVWTENSNQVALGVNPTVELEVGQHTLVLTVTDDEGDVSSDTVVITVNPPGQNQVPIADAGPDQTVSGTNTEIEISNPGFELPASGKIADGFDGAVDVPGWFNGIATYNDSGVEPGGRSGVYRAFLASTDDSLAQTTGHSIVGGAQITLSFFARNTWGGSTLRATLYYEDSGRQTFAQQDFVLTGGHPSSAYTLNATAPSASNGKLLGIEFDNVSTGTTFLGIDDVTLQANVPGQVTLDGSGSSDSDGTLVGYVWREAGCPIATGVNPTVNLSVGTHALELEVTDNDGATATDTVVITVTGTTQDPVANAGADQSVADTNNDGLATVALDGSGSSDPDGTITSYVWTENGNQIATGANPSVDFAIGEHIVQLLVTDNDGISSTDTVAITITTDSSSQITLSNPGFEQPGSGKIRDGFDGAIDVPGWNDVGTNHLNSGVETGYQRSGNYAGFLRGGDDAVSQLTGHTLATGEQIRLSFFARNTWDLSTIRATLYYEDGGQQVILEQDFALENQYPDSPLTLTASVPSAAVGKTLGIRFDNIANGDRFLAVDDVVVELVS
ncbi:MAG: PKD domain-containing protein, partial [Planctomycetota bacterium]